MYSGLVSLHNHENQKSSKYDFDMSFDGKATQTDVFQEVPINSTHNPDNPDNPLICHNLQNPPTVTALRVW